MAFEKCKRCGFMHYSTDPCKSSAHAGRTAEISAKGALRPLSEIPEKGRMGTQAPSADTPSRIEPRAAPKPKFDRNAYQRDYVAKWRKGEVGLKHKK
jgi:hypothetical protein